MLELPSPLIDILSAESFAAEHLPGSVNICFYETAFIDKIRAAFPDPNTALTVYGLNDSTLEAGVALTKLGTAGYMRVSTLPGGLEGWRGQCRAKRGARIAFGPVRGRSKSQPG